ncbi:hypothetical protein [uncultured Rhodoblastus sp.]|uniref:hypothetical protein n=1 Tax=uncultured Rhodoblastus sp. TaxID=543037 RepID=UPI0025E1C49E|nr:hypothetical protein [uncultured Rhodoblastus sp.]
MKLSNRTLLAGLIVAMVSASGVAQATVMLDGVYTEIADNSGVAPMEANAGLGASATLPELPSWALVLLGFAGMGYAGNHQAKKRRQAIAYF